MRNSTTWRFAPQERNFGKENQNLKKTSSPSASRGKEKQNSPVLANSLPASGRRKSSAAAERQKLYRLRQKELRKAQNGQAEEKKLKLKEYERFRKIKLREAKLEEEEKKERIKKEQNRLRQIKLREAKKAKISAELAQSKVSKVPTTLPTNKASLSNEISLFNRNNFHLEPL